MSTGATPRRLVVMRHGETDDNAAGVWQGHRDSPLSQRGREQALRAAPVVAAMSPALVVSSDLQRAADTAEAVAGLLGVPVRLDARLREIDVGEWGGLTAAQVRERDAPTLAALDAGQDVPRGTTGETVSELAVRARAAVDDVVADLAAGETALVVCHGITSRTLVAALVGLDQAQAVRALRGLGNCCWATLTQARPLGPDHGLARWRIDDWNAGAPQPGAAAAGADLGARHAIG